MTQHRHHRQQRHPADRRPDGHGARISAMILLVGRHRRRRRRSPWGWPRPAIACWSRRRPTCRWTWAGTPGREPLGRTGRERPGRVDRRAEDSRGGRCDPSLRRRHPRDGPAGGGADGGFPISASCGRPAIDPHTAGVQFAPDHAAAARAAFAFGQPVLLTTGTRNLAPYVGRVAADGPAPGRPRPGAAGVAGGLPPGRNPRRARPGRPRPLLGRGEPPAHPPLPCRRAGDQRQRPAGRRRREARRRPGPKIAASWPSAGRNQPTRGGGQCRGPPAGGAGNHAGLSRAARSDLE